MFVTEVKDINSAEPHIEATPTVAVSTKGRIFVSFIGNDGERAGILSSKDGKNSFCAVAEIVGDGEEKVEACRLWIDPLGRLWVMWSYLPSARTFCRVCADPDADVLEWGEERELDFGTLLSCPLVAKDGSWLFMSAVSIKEIRERFGSEKKRGMYVHRSTDEGKTFEQISKIFANSCWFDAMALIEKGDKLVAYTRTNYGVGKFISADRGENFRAEADSGYGAESARLAFAILPSKHTLMINSGNFAPDGSRCLAAMLSLTDGMAYHGIMCLEAGRVNTSNPDFCTFGDMIYTVYVRAAGNKNELIFARYTESDVLAGEARSENSKLGIVIL